MPSSKNDNFMWSVLFFDAFRDMQISYFYLALMNQGYIYLVCINVNDEGICSVHQIAVFFEIVHTLKRIFSMKIFCCLVPDQTLLDVLLLTCGSWDFMCYCAYLSYYFFSDVEFFGKKI